jgi:hypothetical protein
MAMESSIIQLGLPALPEENLPPELYDNFLVLHRAIQNLARGVSRYCGVDAPSQEIWNEIPYSETLLTGNLTRMYIPASVAINRGQVINLHNNAGTINARLANAASATTMAHGIANNTVGIGDFCEINWLRGLLSSVGGMTIGTLYWLSTVAGSIQNVAPAGPNIAQPIGLALGPSTLLMDIPLKYTP